jgi:branched-chain amino acid transport system substrate-binding protein
MSQRLSWLSLSTLTAATVLATAAIPAPVMAQQPKEVEVALVVPLSGPWARQGQLERMGAEMAINDINKSGGIKSLGGAKMPRSARAHGRRDGDQ